MAISSIFIVGIVLFVIIAIGGGVGYWIWVASRPKKVTWDAWVYQVGDGLIEKIKKAKAISKKLGKRLPDIKYVLSDLKPYTRDIIEKIDKKTGATHYWLQKLKKPTPVVTADCVEVWGQNKKYVRVLFQEDSCTLLKSGYDRITGTVLFRPMPHDRINMIKTELAERKERIENTKDVLAAITPWVVIGVAMLGLVTMTYFIAQTGVKLADTMAEMLDASIAGQMAIADKYVQAGVPMNATENITIIKEEPPVIPP